MSGLQNSFVFLMDETNAGGTDYVPPALCLRSAHASACTPACANATGKPRRAVPTQKGLFGQGRQNHTVFHD